MAKEYLLTFEWDPKGEKVEIHLDKEGLRKLMSHLEILSKEDGQEHVHLMTPSWAGNDLTEELQGDGHLLVNHVKIMLWP